MKKLLLCILFPWFGIGQVQIGANINGDGQADQFGYGVVLSSNGNFMAVAAPELTSAVIHPDSGYVKIYQNISDAWTQIGSTIYGDHGGDGMQSVAISADGSVVAVGAPTSFSNDPYGGYVKIYKNISGAWTQIGADIVYEQIADNFGYSIALSADGNTVAIGSNYFTPGGKVNVYKNTGGVWMPIGGNLESENASAHRHFGTCVALSSDGSILAVGTDDRDVTGATGNVQVFKNVSGGWIPIGSTIFGDHVADTFGSSIALSSDGNILAVGAPGNDTLETDGGEVKVYQNLSGTWAQLGQHIYGTVTQVGFGTAVSLSSDGNILAVGSPVLNFNLTEATPVRVYKNTNGNWIQRAFVNNALATNQSYFGGAVALSADGMVLAIGAKFDTEEGIFARGTVGAYDLSDILSTDEIVSENFTITPNPTSNKVTIFVNKNLVLNKVNIYNTLGQLVGVENQNVIDIAALAKGSYLFEVITNKGKATKTILVK